MINQALLNKLLAARETNSLIEALHPTEKPANLAEAYATAQALADALNQPVVGWKIGASFSGAWTRLGLSEPFSGRIFGGTTYASPATIANTPGVLTFGAEFAFTLKTNLAADTPPTFTAETVVAEIAAVYPVIELNYPHFSQPMVVGGLSLIADNGVNFGLVVGESIANWQAISLGDAPVSVAVDGQIKSTGRAADIGFDPYAALAWFVNDHLKRGEALTTGHLISSGDLVGPVEAGHGAEVLADFGAFGQVRVRL